MCWLEPTQPPVWEMETGNQSLARWNVKVRDVLWICMYVITVMSRLICIPPHHKEYLWLNNIPNNRFRLPSFIENCFSPSPPQNGYIIPYTSTTEGAKVTYVCWTVDHNTQHQPTCKQRNITAVCTAEGNWEPNYNSHEICDKSSGKIWMIAEHDNCNWLLPYCDNYFPRY